MLDWAPVQEEKSKGNGGLDKLLGENVFLTDVSLGDRDVWGGNY